MEGKTFSFNAEGTQDVGWIMVLISARKAGACFKKPSSIFIFKDAKVERYMPQSGVNQIKLMNVEVTLSKTPTEESCRSQGSSDPKS